MKQVISLKHVRCALAACLLLGTSLAAFAQIKPGGDEPITVEALMKSPSAYTGKVKVVGIVESVVLKKAFVLASEPCCATCKTVRLTVTWKGVAPKPKQRTVVEGTLTVKKNGAKESVTLAAAKVFRVLGATPP